MLVFVLDCTKRLTKPLKPTGVKARKGDIFLECEVVLDGQHVGMAASFDTWRCSSNRCSLAFKSKQFEMERFSGGSMPALLKTPGHPTCSVFLSAFCKPQVFQSFNNDVKVRRSQGSC